MTKHIDEILGRVRRSDFYDLEQFVDDQGMAEDTIHRVAPTRLYLLRAYLEALALSGEERVLHIGTGFGLSAYVLGQLVKSVVTVERLEHRSRRAKERLRRFGSQNVEVCREDSKSLDSIEGMFDAILIETSEVEIVPGLFSRLNTGGRLVYGRQHGSSADIVRFHRTNNGQMVRDVLEHGEVRPGIVDLLVDLGLSKERVERRIGGLESGERKALLEALGTTASPGEWQECMKRGQALGRRVMPAELLVSKANEAVFCAVAPEVLFGEQWLPLEVVDETLLVVTTKESPKMEGHLSTFEAREVEYVMVPGKEFPRLWAALVVQYVLKSQEPTGAFRAVGSQKREESSKRRRERSGVRGEAGSALMRRFDRLLETAHKNLASYVHIEGYREGVRVRFRIQGRCEDHTSDLSIEELAVLIGTIKREAFLDLSEERLPQEGRLVRELGSYQMELRVVIQPTLYGESLVAWLLGPAVRAMTLAQMGFSAVMEELYMQAIQKPRGIFLVGGPGASGRTTTVYEALERLSEDRARKVVTVEDRVEYGVDGVVQTRVLPSIGYRFEDAIRQVRRQDPDVIMVSEIRDEATAQALAEASQAGLLVISTLYARDGIDGIERLHHFGVDRATLSEELNGIIVQRLARRICSNCRVEERPASEMMEAVFGGEPPARFRAFRGMGCEQCRGKGTDGKVAVAEFLEVTEVLREAIARNVPVDGLRAVARRQGLVSMRATALAMVEEGMIEFAEVIRLLPPEQLNPGGS